MFTCAGVSDLVGLVVFTCAGVSDLAGSTTCNVRHHLPLYLLVCYLAVNITCTRG